MMKTYDVLMGEWARYAVQDQRAGRNDLAKIAIRIADKYHALANCFDWTLIADVPAELERLIDEYARLLNESAG